MASRRTRIDWPTFWGALVFLLGGGGFALFGAWDLKATSDYLDGAAIVRAEVIENPPTCDDDGCRWQPVLRVPAPDGTSRTATTRYAASDYSWSEGRVIEVYSNPAYPYVRVTGFWSLWLFGAAFLALGLLPVGLSVWLFARMVVVPSDPGAAKD